jgi:HK97 gp10 family phage protein
MDLSTFAFAIVNWPVFLAKLEEDACREFAEKVASRMRGKVRSRKGNLRKSIRVERGHANGDLLVARALIGYTVRAGGPLTTKPIKRGRLRGLAGTTGVRGRVFGEPDKLFGVSTEPGEAAVGYDYAIAEEYGTHHEPAHPYFRPTIREMAPEWDRVMQQNFEHAVQRMNDYRGL